MPNILLDLRNKNMTYAKLPPSSMLGHMKNHFPSLPPLYSESSRNSRTAPYELKFTQKFFFFRGFALQKLNVPPMYDHVITKCFRR